MNRLLAVLIVAAIALSLLRTRGAEPAADAPTATPPATRDAGATAPAPAPAGALVRLDLQAELPWDVVGPPLELRLRAPEGAAHPFDVSLREAQTRQKLALQATLPVARPELPLRGELLGDAWCIPPGSRVFRIARIDAPYRLVVVRARPLDVQVVADASGAPIAGAEIVHESGVLLARTGIDGRARLVRPRNADARREELLLARASGFLPGAVDDAAGAPPLRLRDAARAGVVRGRVVDAAGAPVAGALVTPRHEPAGIDAPPPDDPAARALLRWLAASAGRELPLLAVASGPDGRFELRAPWPGKLVVTANTRELGRVRETLSNESAPGFAEDGHVTPIELRFPPLVDLRLQARRAGRPLANAAFVLLERDGATTRSLAAATSDAAGRAALRVPAVAGLLLVARAEGLAPQVIELAADPARGGEVAVDFVEGRSVSFVVTGAESLPLTQRVVAWRDVATRLPLGEAPMAADGRVRLDHLPVGRKLELVVASGDEAGISLREIELAPATDAAAAPLDLGALALPAE